MAEVLDLEKMYERINASRELNEAGFVMGLWHDPLMYQDYLHLNENKDRTLKNEQAIFYYNLGKDMYNTGLRVFDEASIAIYLADKTAIQKKYESFDGYDGIAKLKTLTSSENVESYFDSVTKMNSLTALLFDYYKIFNDVEQFNNKTSEDVYNAFEDINNTIGLKTNYNETIDTVTIDNEYITQLEKGDNVGLGYNKYAPILNYITSGCAPSSLYMLGGLSGVGKSSFAFEVLLMGLLESSGARVAIISNEMKVETYKTLLLVHVLIRDLNYWELTRKNITLGQFNTEQKEMIKKAQQIVETKYKEIKFVKVYDNNIGKISKYIKKLKSNYDTDVILLDTWKVDDNATDGIWQTLMQDTRKLFKICDKLNITCITTFQLALATTNQRWLDATCLSNSKQVKEVYETMVYLRVLWEDEYPGEKYDIECYQKDRANPKIHHIVPLDPSKKYLVAFVDKTRADDDKQVLVYEFNSRFNFIKEVGFGKVKNEHKSVR